MPLALVLWGCPGDKESDPQPDPEPLREKTCFIKEISFASHRKGYGRKAFTSRYYYDQQNLLLRVTMDSAGTTFSTMNLTYNNGKQLVESFTDYVRVLHTYNAKGQLINQKTFYLHPDKGPIEQDRFTFRYNGNNELEEALFYNIILGDAYLTSIWKYTYSNGDPVQIERKTPEGERLLLAYLTYDTKKNFKWNLPSIMSFVPTLDAKAAHNVLSHKSIDSYFGAKNYTSVYTYNDEGYPVTEARTYAEGYQEQVTYSYTCQ